MIEVKVQSIHCLSCGARDVPGVRIGVTPDRNPAMVWTTELCHKCRRLLFVKLLRIGTDIQT